MNKRSLLVSFFSAVALSFTGSALAAYPEKPIRLIVGSAPGGAPDVLMRTLGAQMSKQMGVPIVIENKPGASYVISTMDLVRSAPDGYTLAYGNVVSLATNISLLSKVPYNVEKDLTLIANALRVVNLMVVNNDLPVKSVQELISYAKKNPGKVVFGSTVELEEESSGEQVSYQIVGEDEADLKLGLINISSPIARALIGKEEGDVAVVQAPGGEKRYEIVAVSYI